MDFSKNFKRGVILAALVVLIIFVVFATRNCEKMANNGAKTLKIGEISLNIEIADTEIEKENGLSGREKLEENEGMLFVFEKESYYGFWMKDMKFPLDIAWLDESKKIIYIEKNISPETYPKVFNSPRPAAYILETNARFFENSGIKVGDVADF